MKLPELEAQLKEAERGLVEKNYAALVEHLFAKDDAEEESEEKKKNGVNIDQNKKSNQKT